MAAEEIEEDSSVVDQVLGASTTTAETTSEVDIVGDGKHIFFFHKTNKHAGANKKYICLVSTFFFRENTATVSNEH